MAHLPIYLPDDLEERVRKAARAEGTNVSRWVADKVSKAINRSWTPDFVRLAGAFPDFPELDELRRSYGKNSSKKEKVA